MEITLNALGVKKDDAVYVGDSEVDVLTARNSGVDGITVLWGYRDKELLLENGAKTLVSTAEELYKTIKNL